MTGVHHYGQMAQLFHCRNRTQIQRIAGVVLEGADAALAQDNVIVAACHDVFGGHNPLLNGCG